MSRAFTVSNFFEFISEQRLTDITLVSGSFTWSSNRHLPSWSSIDRFPISPDWEVHFPNLIQKRFPRLCSDHFPIRLDCRGLHGAKRYFKFKNMWLKSKDFVDRFSYHFQDSPSYVLARKLKALKADLRA
jgi:hypothetical protein